MATENVGRLRNLRAAALMPVLCIALSTLASVPFFFMSPATDSGGGTRLWMPLTHDMILHVDQMKSFYRGLSSGEIYPRWEEDTNRGFGAPTTSYYPPGVYYLTSLCYLITGEWVAALLVLHLLMFAASGAAIYFYARDLMSRSSSLVVMAAYIFLPYHLIDQYQRGAIAELLGFIWMPLMLLFGERLLKVTTTSDRSHDLNLAEEELGWRSRSTSALLVNAAGVTASFGAFLWSHPPTAYQFAIAYGLYALLLAWRMRAWKGLLVLACAMLVGLGVAAAYLYPALAEQDLIRHEYVAAIWPYHGTYVFVHALKYANTHRAFFDLIDFIWIFNITAILIGAIALLVVEPQFLRSSARLKGRVLLWVIIGIGASFMMTKLSYPIGRMIPKIETGVFTWRMLSITTLIVALVAGACTEAARAWFKARKGSEANSFVSSASLIILGGVLVMATRLLPPAYQAPAFELAKEHLNYALVPSTAPEDPMDLPLVDRAELANGKGSVSIQRWDPEHRSLLVETREQDTLLLRTFTFPGWRATVDGEPATISAGEGLRIETGDSYRALIRAATFKGGTPMIDGSPGVVAGTESLGDIVIQLPVGKHQVNLDYADTPARRLGGGITIVSTVFLGIVMLVVGFSRRKTKTVSTAATSEREA